jgi:alkyl hydroperoxide reductase subunit AhpF
MQERLMEKLLNEQVVRQVKQAFAQMKEPVHLLFFASRENCEYCAEIRQLLDELVEAEGKLGLTVYDLQDNADVAAQFNVDKSPLIVVAAKDGDQIINYGIQYAGIPSGHEFGVLINDILLVSGRDSGLSEAARDFLMRLAKPLHLQVFVTPT